MTKQSFPPGWDEERVREVIERYENQTEDEQFAEIEAARETDGVTLVVDSVSLDLVDGSQVDYVEDLGGAAFKVTNPNAASGCGCGSSFSV